MIQRSPGATVQLTRVEDRPPVPHQAHVGEAEGGRRGTGRHGAGNGTGPDPLQSGSSRAELGLSEERVPAWQG